MISLENNPALKRNEELEQKLKEMYGSGEKIFKEYTPTKLTPLTPEQVYDLITTIYD